MTRHAKPVKSVAQAAPAMVRKQTALLLVVIALLAGVFIGWQGSISYMASQGPARFDAGQAAATQQQTGAASPLMAQAKAQEEVAAKNPNDPAAWSRLGDLYFDSDLHERAVNAYRKSLALKPDQPDVLTDMGVMLRALNKPQEALDAFRAAIAADPKHQPSRLNMGVVYLYDLGDKAGALKAWGDLLAVNPDARTPDGKKLADLVKEVSQGKGQ